MFNGPPVSWRVAALIWTAVAVVAWIGLGYFILP